jgi:tRNA (guanine-N7-)-methyltransferase
MTEPEKPHRVIRSFVRREGRITEAQKRALEELLPRYGVAPGEAPLDFAALFGREAPVHVEIGFGNGEALAAMASAHPENNYLGIEVHRPGVGALLHRLAAEGLTNVRVACTDAKELLAQRIAAGSLSAVYIFFPDPWHKQRHHKRRLVQAEFVALLAQKVKPGGLLHLATDWEDYAQHMLTVLAGTAAFENTAEPGAFTPRPETRTLTRFERRGHRLGHGVRDLVFRRRASVQATDQGR